MEMIPSGKSAPLDDGSGSGYGSNYGYGDYEGTGIGFGDCPGPSHGFREYWFSAIATFALKWPQEQQARLATLRAAGATIAYRRSPAKGGRDGPVMPGLVETVPGPLPYYFKPGLLHATLEPLNWRGERWWIVALLGEVRGDDLHMWALKREVIGECV